MDSSYQRSKLEEGEESKNDQGKIRFSLIKVTNSLYTNEENSEEKGE